MNDVERNTADAIAVEAYVVEEAAPPAIRDVSPAAARPPITVENPALRPMQNVIAMATIWLPFLGALAAAALAFTRGVGWLEITLCVVGFVLTTLGIEFGMHRVLAHRAVDTYPWVKVLFAVLGSMAAEGRLLYWVASHRRHHAHSDTRYDPHSPHVRRIRGKVESLDAVRGLWHAHVGHMLTDEITNCTLFARDVNRDPALRRVSELYEVIMLAGLVLPGLIGFVAYGTLWGAFTCFLWGGLVRMFLVHHTTWSVASVCHRFGNVRFHTGDRSRNNLWLAIPSFGSAWQNNHHAFPNSAHLGLRWWEIDLTALFCQALSVVGLAWNVRRPTPAQIEKQRLKAESSAGQDPAIDAARVG